MNGGEVEGEKAGSYYFGFAVCVALWVGQGLVDSPLEEVVWFVWAWFIELGRGSDFGQATIDFGFEGCCEDVLMVAVWEGNYGGKEWS